MYSKICAAYGSCDAGDRVRVAVGVGTSDHNLFITVGVSQEAIKSQGNRLFPDPTLAKILQRLLLIVPSDALGNFLDRSIPFSGYSVCEREKRTNDLFGCYAVKSQSDKIGCTDTSRIRRGMTVSAGAGCMGDFPTPPPLPGKSSSVSPGKLSAITSLLQKRRVLFENPHQLLEALWPNPLLYQTRL